MKNFNSFLRRKYSNLLTAAAFSNSSYSRKTSSPTKNPYVSTFLGAKAKILAVYLPKSCQVLFCLICYQLFWFSHRQSYYSKFFLNLNGLPDGKVISFNKLENDFLV